MPEVTAVTFGIKRGKELGKTEAVNHPFSLDHLTH